MFHCTHFQKSTDDDDDFILNYFNNNFNNFLNLIAQAMTSVQVWGFDSNLNRGITGSITRYIIDDSLQKFVITDCHDVLLLSNRINIGSITLNSNHIEPLINHTFMGLSFT